MDAIGYFVGFWTVDERMFGSCKENVSFLLLILT